MTRLGRPSTARPRPTRERARTADERMRFAAEVRAHLERTPRQLPSRYLYDELGSALFEAICRLPWYRITRAEERLLLAGRDDVLRLVRPLACVVELGPGSGAKLVELLSAPAREARPLDVHLVDLSPAALEMAACAVGQLSGTRVLAHEAEYLAGIREAVGTRPPAGHALVVFLGSNIGNLDPGAARVFLGAIRTMLRTGDALLLGADLIKPARELALAYDDPLGVTAAFNRNLLVRMNRELGADFDVEAFAHRAVWNGGE